jgi:hypothetical protein
MRQREAVPIDEVVGRIVDVDRRYGPVASKLGKPDWIQDIQIETPDRQRLCIAFYNLSVRCFSSRRGDEQREAWFTPDHKDKWVKVRDTLKGKDNKSCLKTIPPNKQTKKQNEFYGNKGIIVILKATSAVAVSWLVDKGQTLPEISTTPYQKQKQQLRVPGGESAPTTPPAKQESKPMMEMKSALERVAFSYLAVLGAMQNSYRRAAAKNLIQMPPDEEFGTAVTTVWMNVTDKVNVYETTEDQIKAVANRVSAVFVLQQIKVAEVAKRMMEADQTFTVPPASRMTKIAQACFIKVTKTYAVHQPPKKQNGG